MRFDKERFFEDLQEKIPEVYGKGTGIDKTCD